MVLGEPQNFTVQVTPDSNYPLDLYILMDLSHSMLGDLGTVRALLDNLGKPTFISLPLASIHHHNTNAAVNCVDKVYA